MITLGNKLSLNEDLNNLDLFQGLVTIYFVSGPAPKNAPNGVSQYGTVIFFNAGRKTQLYIDSSLGIKTRVLADNSLSNWI